MQGEITTNKYKQWFFKSGSYLSSAVADIVWCNAKNGKCLLFCKTKNKAENKWDRLKEKRWNMPMMSPKNTKVGFLYRYIKEVYLLHNYS